MKITKRSGMTGVEHTMDLPVTQAQLDELETPGGRFIQDIFPDLDASQREFLLTGITDDEWATLGDPEDDDQDECSCHGDGTKE